MNKKIHIITSIIIIGIIAGGAFYWGMLYGKTQSAKTPFTAGNFQGVRANRAGVNGNFVTGNIISKDGNSITVQLPNNAGSKIIFYSDATQVSKTISGTSADLMAGETVITTGTTNSDGSITAQSIQIRPAGLVAK